MVTTVHNYFQSDAIRIEAMSDQDPPSPRRRSVLRTAALAGSVSAAGCSFLDQESSPTETPRDDEETPTQTPRDDDSDTEGRSALDGIHGLRIASQHATGGEGTREDPWTVESPLLEEHGMVKFDTGTFETDGLKTSLETDFGSRSVWLEGAGVRTTDLRKTRSDEHLVAFLEDEPGNFGGIRDMALYGNGPDGEPTDGHLFYSNGGVYDIQLENVIIRWGYNTGVRVRTSASGTRVRNSWIENLGGWGIDLGGGSRAKLDNLHVVSCQAGGVRVHPTISQLSNTTFYNCSPGLVADTTDCQFTNSEFYLPRGGTAIEESAESRRNQFSNLGIEETTVGVESHATDSTYSNIGVWWATSEAMQLHGTNLAVNGLTAVDVGSSGTPVLTVTGDDCRLSGVSVRQESDPFVDHNRFARITGDHVVVDGVRAIGGPWSLEIDGATETVVTNATGIPRSAVADGGTRTLFNGAGTNDGAPDETGEWHGHAEYAFDTNATVWDTTTGPWTPYRASGDGSWVALA